MDELELKAKSGEPMPSGLTLREQKAFQAVAFLTARYRAGCVDGDTAKAEILQIRNSFKHDTLDEKYIKRCADLWNDIEAAAREYATERTLDAADKMYEVIYGMRCNNV